MGLLDGRVALVTGAGGGLGRAHALLLAREGARVVVNDLGGAVDGAGAGSAMADQVVAEIREAGGAAVANYASVADPAGAESMVQDALEHFGRLDIVVNNAGILRDKTLLKMTDEMWDLVQEVHLKGTFLVTRAAVRHMRDRGEGGRIINTSSFSGLKGNFGQANYGAAKAGIAGFTRVVAIETRRAGITANCIAPVAKTRMTDDLDTVPGDYQPEDISPLVVWLASDEAAEVTGRVFGAHGRHYFEYKVEMTPGVESDHPWSVAEVGQRWQEITTLPQPEAPAAQGEASPADQVRALFAAMPAALKAEKARQWRATVHFDVKGTGTYGLRVADGGCTFTEAPQGAPDGTITFGSAQVLLDMTQGKLKPEQAFMAGQIKSDNMDILMSFGRYFDLARAAELAASSQGAAREPDAGALVDEAFARMGEAFVPEKAAGWTSTLHFKVGEAKFYTVEIRDAKVSTQQGLQGDPSGTIAFESEGVFLGIVSGEVNPQQAFMAGQIKADNMGELMRYAQCFDMRRAAEAAAARKDQGQAVEEEAQGLNVELVGRRYKGSAQFIKPEHIAAYAAATDDPNPAYEGEGAVAPPLMPVRPMLLHAEELLMGEELNADMGMLVHGEQDMIFHRHIRPWDLVAVRTQVDSIEQKSSGQVLTMRQWLMCEGECVNETVSTFFIRARGGGGGGGGGKKPKKPVEVAEPAPREIVSVDEQEVALDQSRRYAHASGDMNPIHLDNEVARAVGLPSIILHGLCTMAFASRAVVMGPCEGDPKRLHRLKVRFTKPVLPGWTLRTQVWREQDSDGRQVYGLEMSNQDGVVVLTQALAEVKEA